MALRTGFLIFMAAACIGPAQGQDQPQAATEKPSAKDLFLHPRQMPYGVQDETPAPAKPKSSVKPKPQPKPTETASVAVPVVQASYSELALRYTLRKRDGDRSTDVAADSEFHSGDRIQLSVEVNDTGYLYIINQGTSGAWKAMFPSPEIENGVNQVQRGPVYTMPPGRHVFTFNDTPGVERLFVIFSRQPVQEIDSLIYSLQGGQQAPAADHGKGRPVAPVLTATAKPIDDSRIAQMRAAYSRDLIVEDLGHEQSGPQQDKSVYVANPKGSPDSRVVADIPLTHK